MCIRLDLITFDVDHQWFNRYDLTNCHWHDAIWLQKEKKLKQLQVVTYMPSKYLSFPSQQKKQWKTNKICLKLRIKTPERLSSERPNSVPICFLLQILHILESVEINPNMGRKRAIFFEGTVKCIRIVLDLDSLSVEILYEIWKRVDLVSSPNLTWNFQELNKFASIPPVNLKQS